MTHTYAHNRFIFACLLAALVAVPAMAAPENVVAELENTGGKIVVYPVIEEFDRIMFTVTGPCNYEYREVIEPGGIGVFRTSSETIDAMYRLELVAMPKVSGDILDVLAQARKNNDNSEVDELCREGALPGAPLTQNLGFRIFRGEIVWDPDKQEEEQSGSPKGPAIADGGGGLHVPLKDFVINDDLIVDGSACIGFDCVNGESFSFDTIRLKENNLRIKFDDTSVAASFPRTDWQLTANASANGGASKFSIDDISGSRTPFTVEANARSHSLYVDDGGRIGNRTSTPSTEIHTIDGDTPTLRLQQDGSSGFAPQTWDVAGNETNFFIRDVTNGSTLPFRIRPGAPTSSIFIDVDGDVGLGTASPDGALHIENTGGDDEDDFMVDEDGNLGIGETSPEAQLHLTDASQPEFRLENTAASNQWSFQTSSGGNFVVTVVGSGGTEMRLRPVNAGVNPGALEIDGDFISNGTALNVPDYVFEDRYELMSLSDLEAFIEENHHLPKIPSASDVKDHGLNMSQLQMQLLEKIEELTLYTLQQQKTIDALEKNLAEVTEELRSAED